MTRADVAAYRRLVPLLRPYRLPLAGAFVLAAGGPLLTAARIWLLKLLIDAVLPGTQAHLLIPVAAAFVGIALVRGVLTFGEERLTGAVGTAVVGDLRAHLYADLQGMSLRYFHGRRLGDLLTRLSGRTENVTPRDPPATPRHTVAGLAHGRRPLTRSIVLLTMAISSAASTASFNATHQQQAPSGPTLVAARRFCAGTRSRCRHSPERRSEPGRTHGAGVGRELAALRGRLRRHDGSRRVARSSRRRSDDCAPPRCPCALSITSTPCANG